MIKTIEFKGERYPMFQTHGNAAEFAIPFAKKICKGIGFDIGFSNPEWKFPGAVGIDLCVDDEYDAFNLPDYKVDYIFSSHCLEHLSSWVDALDYWVSCLKPGGVLFLYLPHKTQKYWRPYFNRKHIHSLDPELIQEFLLDLNMKNIFVSSYDLNNSFYVIAEKQ